MRTRRLRLAAAPTAPQRCAGLPSRRRPAPALPPSVCHAPLLPAAPQPHLPLTSLAPAPAALAQAGLEWLAARTNRLAVVTLGEKGCMIKERGSAEVIAMPAMSGVKARPPHAPGALLPLPGLPGSGPAGSVVGRLTLPPPRSAGGGHHRRRRLVCSRVPVRAAAGRAAAPLRRGRLHGERRGACCACSCRRRAACLQPRASLRHSLPIRSMPLLPSLHLPRHAAPPCSAPFAGGRRGGADAGGGNGARPVVVAAPAHARRAGGRRRARLRGGGAAGARAGRLTAGRRGACECRSQPAVVERPPFCLVHPSGRSCWPAMR